MLSTASRKRITATAWSGVIRTRSATAAIVTTAVGAVPVAFAVVSMGAPMSATVVLPAG